MNGQGAGTHSLLVRSTVALGVALVLVAAALLLFFQPFLEQSVRQETAGMLAEQAADVRAAAGLDADETERVLRDGVAGAWDAAAGVARDAPLELMDGDPERLRAHLAERLEAESRAADRRLSVVMDEMRERNEHRIRDASVRERTAGAERASRFAAELGLRAASLLLALLAVVFLVHGVLLWRAVLAPVRRLAEATQDVADGRLATRIEVRGDDEVARLGGSFNQMTEALEKALGDLRALNATLEERVREKTSELSAALEESREANRRLEEALHELRATERELRHAEKMASLGTLAGGIAHEFNNLLGGILGCAEDAAEERDEAELRRTLAVIGRTARRGTAVTANLLRFARPSRGREEDVDAAALVRDVAALVEHEAVRGGVEVRVAVSGTPHVQADPSGLHQVLLNLATNALHAMEGTGPGRLVLGVSERGGDVVFEVSDTGCGIAPADRDRLFEPFFTTRGEEGTGLGLSVSYGIVKAHGGRLTVESEPGRGSVFTVAMPRSAATVQGEAS